MTRTGLALDPASVATLRNLSKRLGTSQSEVVRRSLRLLEQRVASMPDSPAEALAQLAQRPAAQMKANVLKARIRQQRRDRHAADESRR